MTATAFGALSTMQKIVWATAITNAGRDKNFWMSNGFVGQNTEDMSKPIHRVTELTPTEGGTAAVLPLVSDLVSDGQVGDDMVDGNEEALINDAIIIQIDQLRHGVRSKGKYAEQETVLRFRSLAREKLSFWLADTMDELMFLTVGGVAYTFNTDGSARATSRLPDLRFAGDVTAPSTNRVIYAGAATSTASVVVTETTTWGLIVQALTRMKRQRVKPIMDRGKPYFVAVLSTEAYRDMLLDPTFQTIMSRAAERGLSKNPLFTNAQVVVQGVVIYEHNKIFNTLGAASGSKWGAGGTVDGTSGLVMGAQALGLATLGAPAYEEEKKDYKNRDGVAYGRMFGLLKPVFRNIYTNTSEDFGVMLLRNAAAENPA